ncbi:MAG: hypothetical protein NVS2B14_13650 [Chamaesiphon sp.]
MDAKVGLQPFSYAYYKYMLEQSIKANYVITSFEKYDSQYPKTIVLRHDVDYTMDGLIEFAKIETNLGCSATYLFRVHADEYNLFSCSSWKVIQQIKALGHEIGLHFEAMNVGRALNIDPVKLLKREKNTIEAILGERVLTCSEHRELSGLIHSTPTYDELYDPYKVGFVFFAMDKKYIKEMKYLSDSNANWREGDITEHLNNYDRFQILVHPDWWFEKDLLLKGPYYHSRETYK